MVYASFLIFVLLYIDIIIFIVTVSIEKPRLCLCEKIKGEREMRFGICVTLIMSKCIIQKSLHNLAQSTQTANRDNKKEYPHVWSIFYDGKCLESELPRMNIY